MKNRNIWLTTVAICLLFLCAAVTPARAGDSSLPSSSSSWGNTTTVSWWFTWNDSWTSSSPVNWLWGNVWQAILNCAILAPDPESPVYSEPTKLCGGDDGFNQFQKE
jgi:hypothetical protein